MPEILAEGCRSQPSNRARSSATVNCITFIDMWSVRQHLKEVKDD
jgi:hypothetical protein